MPKSNRTLDEEKSRSEFNNPGPNIVKNIFASLTKGWNILFPSFLKPSRLFNVSIFQMSSRDIKGHFNKPNYKYLMQEKSKESCNTKSIDASNFFDHQTIALQSEMRKEFYFLQSLSTNKFAFTVSFPNQINMKCMNTFSKDETPNQILVDANNTDFKFFKQNITAANITKKNMEICNINTEKIHNFHFLTNFIRSTLFSSQYAQNNAIFLKLADSCNFQLFRGENSCDGNSENERSIHILYYASEKSSANNSSANLYSFVASVMNSEACDRFLNFPQNPVDVYFMGQDREMFSRYLKANEKIHKEYDKPCIIKFPWDTDMCNARNSETDANFENNIAINSNLQYLTSNIQQNVTNYIFVSIYINSPETSNEYLMPERNTKVENLQHSLRKYEIINVKNKDHIWNNNITSQLFNLVAKLDQEKCPEICLQIKFNNYSVFESIQLHFKFKQTVADIKQYIEKFDMVGELMRFVLRMRSGILLSKLLENMENYDEIANNLLVREVRNVSTFPRDMNSSNNCILKLKEATNNGYIGGGSNTNLSNDIQETLYSSSNIEVIEKGLKFTKRIKISKEEMPACVGETRHSKEKHYDDTSLNEDFKTDDYREVKVHKQIAPMFCSDLEVFIDDSSDGSDSDLSTIIDLESEFSLPELPEIAFSSTVYRKKLGENCNADLGSMKYKHRYHFYLTENCTSDSISMKDSKSFNMGNEKNDISMHVKNKDKMRRDVNCLKGQKSVPKVKKNSEKVNIAYTKNDIDYDTHEYKRELYSHIPVIHKRKYGEKNCVNKPYGNETILSKSRRKRKILNDNKNTESKECKKHHRISTTESETQIVKELKLCAKNSNVHSSKFLSSTMDRQKDLHFVAQFNKPSDSTRYKTGEKIKNKLVCTKDANYKLTQLLDSKKKEVNNKNCKSTENHFYEKIGKQNINLCHSERSNSIQSTKGEKSSRKIKVLGLDKTIRKADNIIAAEVNVKSSRNLQHASQDNRMHATPIVNEQSKWTNKTLLSGRQIKEKGKDQISENTKQNLSKTNNRKKLKSDSRTDHQHFMPKSVRSIIIKSMECERFPNANELTAEKHKKSASSGRKRKNSERSIKSTECERFPNASEITVEKYKKSVLGERKLNNSKNKVKSIENELDKKPTLKYKVHDKKSEINCTPAKFKESEIPTKQEFCLNKKNSAKKASHFIQLKNGQKINKKSQSITDPISSYYSDTFDSRDDKSFTLEQTAKNNYHTQLVSKLKPNHYCYSKENEKSVFNDRFFPERSNSGNDLKLNSNSIRSSKRQIEMAENKLRKRTRTTYPKSRHISSYVNEVATLDDLLLSSKRQST